jgi:hypothetical protein
MTIKQQGGIFGRNPSFNDVEVESLTIAGNAVPDASTILVDGDIGSTVQGYDADTTKNDVANAFTENQSILNGLDSTLFLGKGAEGADGVTKIKSYQSGADTDQLGLAFFVHTSGSGSSPTNEAVRIDHNLRLNMVGGGNILLNSGAGIDFSATSGTGTSELFDDYEEGTWTPTVNVGTATVEYANYTKIGRQVIVSAYLHTFSDTSTATNVQIGGLPFTSSSNNRTAGSMFGRNIAAGTGVIQNSPYIASSATTINLFGVYTGSFDPIQFADFDGSTQIYVTISYIT